MSEIAKREHGAIDMTQGSPTRLIVAFSLPLLLGNVPSWWASLWALPH